MIEGTCKQSYSVIELDKEVAKNRTMKELEKAGAAIFRELMERNLSSAVVHGLADE